MLDTSLKLLPYAALAGQAAFAVILLALIFRKSWGREVAEFAGKHALVLAFLVSLAAVFGSLFYSEIAGYEPCPLCWWQRVMLYPSVILLGIAAFKKDRSIFTYVVPLAAISAVIAFYQYYATSLGGSSLLACTDAGGACSKVYVNAFGYITIELMSLTASALILVFAWAGKLHKKDESR